MTLEELKRQLEAGEITKEEYDAAVAALEEGKADPEEEKRKAIQAAEDRVRTQYTKKQKELEAELEKIRREKMTEEERVQLEREEHQKQLEEREQALLAREVELHTVNTLQNEGLPLSMRNFVTGSTVEDTDSKINEFKQLWKSELDKAVQAAFKQAGRDPNKKGGSKSDIANPWKPGQINLTQQGQMLKEDPELARQLMAAAGN